MKHTLPILMLALGLGGCQSEPFLDQTTTTPYNPQKVICLLPQPQQADSSFTRGTPITNANEMTDLGMFCSYTGSTNWSATSQPQKAFNVKLQRNTTTNAWQYTSTPINWAPGLPTDFYSFFAYAPFATASNGIVVQGLASTPGIPTLTYTAPADAALQPDLMLARIRYDRLSTAGAVPLRMHHVLTCVGFEIQGNGQKIKAITLSGIATRGTIEMDGTAPVWNLSSQPATPNVYTPILNFDPGKEYYTVTTTNSTSLITGNGYLMMIPQTLGPSAQLTLTLVGGTNYTIPLNTQTWQVGKKITYNILMNNNGIIVMSPIALYISSLGSNQLMDRINLACQPTNLNWRITTNASWLKLTTDASGAGALQTLSGTGNATLYTLSQANLTNIDRATSITFADDNIPISQVTQLPQKLPISYPKGGQIPTNTYTYTGAFWRANEKGERIIRIPVGTNAANLGTWTASVVWTDPNWGVNDILFSTTPTTDPGVSHTSNTPTPGNPESYLVAENNTAASGTVPSSGYIYFRLAIRSTYTPTPAAPARYAVVSLQYNNRTKTQLLFLRQGEQPDYLMRPTDPSTGNYSASARPLARKVSPFNLTVPSSMLATFLGGPNIISHPTLALNGGNFVTHPTQAGAFFQWAPTINIRRAYHPTYPQGDITLWNEDINTTFWKTTPAIGGVDLSTIHEVCPPGYRRISDGSEVALSGTSASTSELHQSLNYNLSTTQVFDGTNLLPGYYADGFFDRRMINTYPGITKPCIVSYYGNISDSRNAKVAYAGILIYNPLNGNSLFFPAAGTRSIGGAVANVMQQGFYWTSSVENFEHTATALCPWMTPQGALYATDHNRFQAMNIRCVKTP